MMCTYSCKANGHESCGYCMHFPSQELRNLAVLYRNDKKEQFQMTAPIVIH